jgi:hypothetical protein
MFRLRTAERKNRGLIPCKGKKILLFIKMYRPVVGLTMLSTKRVKRALHPRVNQLKNEVDHYHVSIGEVQNELKHTPVPHIPSWHALGLGV